MTEIDYSAVTPDQLALKREPRKSRFSIVHKPSGQVGETPVTPDTLTEARFRRPTTVPKENRVPDMEGFIEGRGDEAGIWMIVAGEEPRNEYLTALCENEDALKACFEGGGNPGNGDESQEATDPQESPPADTAQGGSIPGPTPGAEQPSEEEEVSDDTKGEIDDLLAGIEGED